MKQLTIKELETELENVKRHRAELIDMCIKVYLNPWDNMSRLKDLVLRIYDNEM